MALSLPFDVSLTEALFGKRLMANAPTHKPVMLSEVLTFLDPRPGDTVVDATAGCGGYSLAIRERLGARGLLVASDRDPEMARIANERLKAGAGAPFRVFVAKFSELPEVLRRAEAPGIDGLTADFGVASPQIDLPERGFSYRVDGPLSMRMSPGSDLSAEQIVNHWPESELARVFREYGEERHARRVARRLCERRRSAPIRTTLDLAEVIRDAVPPGPRRLHPARRCFQALRMACNRELEEIDALLSALPGMLRPGARAVFVSYHSLEDRAIKNHFADGERRGVYERLTKKVARPSGEEVADNPRARSARLRAARRLEAETAP